jgi:hypothetical protein
MLVFLLEQIPKCWYIRARIGFLKWEPN